MRICLVSRYFSFRNAGIGRVGLELARGLVKRGHSVNTVQTTGSSLYSYLLYTGVQLPFKVHRDVDVYHALTPMEAMWLPKSRSVVTFHDILPITDPGRLGSGLGYSGWKNLIGRRYFALASSIAKRCAQVVAVSEKTKMELVDYLHIPMSRVTVIRSGVSQGLVPMLKRDDIFRVGYLGQLDRRKRVDLLITAFRRSDLDELVIGGAGADETRLRSLVDGDPRIKFLGVVPDRSLADFYSSLSVFAFPTWAEGYGLPAVEAMACKVPVIMLIDAHVPEEVRKRCLITDRLDYLLGNRKYLEGRCAAIHTEGNYTWAKEHDWDEAVRQYIALYEEITG